MEEKEKLKVESIEIDPTILQNIDNLINPTCSNNYERQFYELYIVFLYSPKYQVIIEYFIFVSTHVP